MSTFDARVFLGYSTLCSVLPSVSSMSSMTSPRYFCTNCSSFSYCAAVGMTERLIPPLSGETLIFPCAMKSTMASLPLMSDSSPYASRISRWSTVRYPPGAPSCLPEKSSLAPLVVMYPVSFQEYVFPKCSTARFSVSFAEKRLLFTPESDFECFARASPNAASNTSAIAESSSVSCRMLCICFQLASPSSVRSVSLIVSMNSCRKSRMRSASVLSASTSFFT